MTTEQRVAELETLLTDLMINAEHMRRNPRKSTVRAECGRACDRARLYFKKRKVEEEFDATAPSPEDPRPQPRLPYRDD